MQMKIKHFRSIVIAVASALAFAIVFGCANVSHAQGAGVPVFTWDSFGNEEIMAAAEKLYGSGKLIRETSLTNQLRSRKSCELKLAAPRTEKLAGRELW